MSYATTPTLSDDAGQVSVSRFCTIGSQIGCPGTVGGCVSTGAATRTRSRLGPPLADVDVSAMVLAPALSVTLKVSVTHVDHAPVPWNAMFCTVVPLTDRSIGRTVVVPLANRISTLYEPAAPALFTAQ